MKLPGCQAAQRLTTIPLKGYPYLAEPLLTGDRVLIHVVALADGGAAYWAPSGAKPAAVKATLPFYSSELARRGGVGLIFDGVADAAGYQVFDAYRPDRVTIYNGGKQFVVPFRVRRDFLELLFEAPEYRHPTLAPAGDQRVTLIEQRRVTGRADAEDYHDCNAVGGYVGTVFKQPGASYVFDTTSGWQVLQRG